VRKEGFVCPKCRLSLLITEVYAVPVGNIISDFDRLCRLYKAYPELKLNNSQLEALGIPKGRSLEAISEWGDESESDDEEKHDSVLGYKISIPTALKTAFPYMSLQEYTRKRSEPTFLLSTVELCQDCFLTVRQPGSVPHLHHARLDGNQRKQKKRTKPKEITATGQALQAVSTWVERRGGEGGEEEDTSRVPEFKDEDISKEIDIELGVGDFKSTIRQAEREKLLAAEAAALMEEHDDVDSDMSEPEDVPESSVIAALSGRVGQTRDNSRVSIHNPAVF